MDEDIQLMEEDSMMGAHNQSSTTNSHINNSHLDMADDQVYNKRFNHEESKDISLQITIEAIKSINEVVIDSLFESQFEELSKVSWNPSLFTPDEFNKCQILINDIIQNRNLAGESETR